MDTAEIKEPYNYVYKLKRERGGNVVKYKEILEGTYKILSRFRNNVHGMVYLLEIDGKSKTFSQSQLKNIKIKEFNMEEIEKELLKEDPIRIERTRRKRKEPLEDFLIDFIINRNINKDTIYVKNREIHTVKNKRRSLGDLFLICKYYYPECSLKDVANLLYNVYPQMPKKYGFRSSYCGTIHKRVFYYNGTNGNIFNKTMKDEYGKKWKEWQKLTE